MEKIVLEIDEKGFLKNPEVFADLKGDLLRNIIYNASYVLGHQCDYAYDHAENKSQKVFSQIPRTIRYMTSEDFLSIDGMERMLTVAGLNRVADALNIIEEEFNQ